MRISCYNFYGMEYMRLEQNFIHKMYKSKKSYLVVAPKKSYLV